MSVEQWGLLVTLFSLLIGAGALYYAKRATSVSEQQLAFAREEALRHPKLEVGSVSLRNAEEFDEILASTRVAQEAWREVAEKHESDKMEFYEKLEAVENAPYTVDQAFYEGPYPDLVLTFELRNLGNRTAREVSGAAVFDSTVLDPLDFPGFEGGRQAGLAGTIKLSVADVSPARSEEVLVYRIALLRRGSGTTTAKTIFSTPEGNHWEEALELKVP